MRHLRILALCLVGAFALAATTAAGASASEPSVWQCRKLAKNAEKKYTGKYLDKKCSEEATEAQQSEGKKNKYELVEWSGPVKKGGEFKGKGKLAELEIQGVGNIVCQSTKDTGFFTGAKEVGKIDVVFSGCTLHGHTCESTTPKAKKAGEVLINPLKGTIGYISKARDEVGVELKPEAGLYETELNCGELKLRTSGAVVGLVKPPYNEIKSEVTLTFDESAGVQDPQKLEGGPLAQLYTEIGSVAGSEYGEPKLSGESTENTGKGEELELKA